VTTSSPPRGTPGPFPEEPAGGPGREEQVPGGPSGGAPGATAMPRHGERPQASQIPALALLAVVLTGVSLTSGLWRDLGGRMVSGNLPDAMHYSWWLGWTVDALGRADDPLLTTAMNWPEGVSAMSNTTLLLPALVLSPVTLLSGPLVSLNLLNVLAVPACALAAYWSGRRLGLRPAAAVAAAAVFALSPAIVNSLVGHVTMAFAPALPILAALSVDAWRGRPGWTPVRTGVVLGLVAVAQVFTGEEVLFQAGLGAVLVLVVAALSNPSRVRQGAARLGRTLGVAFAVFLPIAGYPLYLQFAGPLAHHGNPFLADYYAADLTAFTTPTAQQLLHRASDVAASARFPGGQEEHLAYLGWPLVLTCLTVTLWRWRDLRVRCAAVGLVASAVLSLGGRLWVGGTWTETAGPYAVLQRLPVVEASLASRLGLLVAVFAAALLGLAVDAVLASGASGRRMVAAALAAVCVIPLVPRPLDTVPAPEVPPYFAEAGRTVREGSVLVVLPYPVATRPVAMRWQSEAGYRFSMPGGYFLGPAADGRAYVGGAPDPPTAQLLATVADSGQPADVTPEQREQAARDLDAWQADAIVLGPDPAREALRATVVQLLGRQPVQEGGVDVWTLDPVPS
jgi:hypothetical protein